MKTGTEKITVNGFEFEIGYQCDSEFADYVCMMKKGNDWYGVRWCGVGEFDNELGWNTGLYATNEELEAIRAARDIMYKEYGKRYTGSVIA